MRIIYKEAWYIRKIFIKFEYELNHKIILKTFQIIVIVDMISGHSIKKLGNQ